jgi:peptidoglycan hydrolase-like protein with peptidoglycan-binding domain
MRLPLIVALLACACVLSGEAAQAQTSGSASTASGSSSSSAAKASPSKPASHKKKHHEVSSSRRQPYQKAPTSDRITEIQTALARGGYYQADPNGKWDSTTVAAVEKFQSAHGIDADGKLDAPTLQKLGLGSDIAGVSAPRPPVPPSAFAAPATPSSQNSAAAASSAVAQNSVSAGTSPSTRPAEH